MKIEAIQNKTSKSEKSKTEIENETRIEEREAIQNKTITNNENAKRIEEQSNQDNINHIEHRKMKIEAIRIQTTEGQINNKQHIEHRTQHIKHNSKTNTDKLEIEETSKNQNIEKRTSET